MALKGVQHALILKRASASRPSGQWKEDDFDVLADGVVVGRTFNSTASPVGTPWMWTLVFEEHHKAARPPTVMSRRARPRWQRSLRAGGGNESSYPYLTKRK
jgi:hypothetical protein